MKLTRRRPSAASIPLAELAKRQGVVPIDDLRKIAALWPVDDDPDELFRFILKERRARRRLHVEGRREQA